jgi:hypothetical protein
MPVYYKADSVNTGKDIVYGRLVSPSGAVGNEIRISSGLGKQTENNVAFDGTNFFVVWCDNASNNEVKGRFVNPSGTLGTEMTVKASGLPNDNPLTVAFDGTNYLVVWTDEITTSPNNWDVFGQLVTSTGALSGGRITISTASGQQIGPVIAFDGTNYLVSWTDMRNDANGNWACDTGEGTCMDIRGQFVNKSGVVVGAEFIISNAAGNQLGGLGGQAVNGKLFGLINTGLAMSGEGLTGGDVYGVFMTVEKIPMMTIADLGMNLYLYDPVSQTMNTVKQNTNGMLVSLNSGQTMLAYTEFLSEAPSSGETYRVCLYNIASKATNCLTTPTVEQDAVAFDNNGKLLFIDKSGDGLLKRMNPDGTNITSIATPVSPYRFNVFWLSPDRQKIIAVEETHLPDYSNYYTTNYARLVLMNADGTNRTIIKEGYLGQWNMLFWKADTSKVFYYHHTFNVVGGVYQGKTPHYVVIDIPGGTATDLTGSAVGGKVMNICAFTKSGNLLSLMHSELYNGQTGALIAARADAPSMMAARVGFDMGGEIYFANLDGTNFRRFVESSTAGACGTANGQSFTSAPVANLCSAGTPTTVTGSGPWTWSCAGLDGGTTANCTATVIQTWTVTPSAGTGGTINPNTPQIVNHNATTQFTVTANAGYTASVGGTCGGSLSGTTYTTNAVTGNCTVSATFTANPVNGACGTANGQAFTTAPTANLCSVGTPTSVAGGGPWTWSCAGSNGGSTAKCSANISPWREDFSATALDSPWQVVSGRGSHSLTDNPGHLRYSLGGPQAYSGSSLGIVSNWSPSLSLIRPFGGDNWVLKTKATYNIKWQGTGAQYQVLYIAFGEGNGNYLRINRGTDQWYNANVLTAELVVNGQAVASNNNLRAPNDVVVSDWLRYPYWYEITRNGPCVTLRYSYDGTNYMTAFSAALSAGVTAAQRVIIDGNVWTTAGSYVDWDYIHVDPTAIPLRGDLNSDAKVDLADAILALKAVAGMGSAGIRTDYATCGADVNCDGQIGAAEASYILQTTAGIR